ncbi:uncharacterized protein ALTATR162_LOCUS5002 [Alternaria atra]|uniref:Uncharacterized protein n=1 Tax=Alternaria atra TaxID=119953 RepID=A0A8J2N5P1_9PLEO|nr:uncharacterized protein ALTATR162_LOCUS5002 [Alternaria atra]CAG5158138.1 unnamed protein product [Alternaria atra]
MAHQAHIIPWQTLVDNLKYKHCNPRNHGITNLYLRNTRPHQEKELQYFVGGFDRALSKYSAIERKKYDVLVVPPQLDDKVISEDAIKKMARTVLRYKGKLDTTHTSDSLGGVLSSFECTTRRFVSDTYPGDSEMCDCIHDACEQTKAMLLHGEMDSLLRLAAHPSVYFHKFWDENQYANAQGFGLSKLKDSAIQAYICLNVMFLKPELYNPVSRKAFIQEQAKANRTTFQPDLYDYRLTAAYQHMLLCCTGVSYGLGHYEAHTYPHREFFGIPRGMLHVESTNFPYKRQPRSHLGTIHISDLVDDQFKGIYMASKADVPIVLELIKTMGLPTELALHIMSMADYTPVGRMFVRDDPLHSANTDELKKYLCYCWKLLVRIDMLCKASGQWLDWEAEATDAICTLFEMNSPSRRKVQKVSHTGTEFSGRTQKVVFV